MHTPNLLMCTLCVVIAAYLASRYYENFQLNRDRPFKIVSLPGRGKGAVATRDIQQGEMIIKEEPLFLVHADSFQDPAQDIRTVVSKLNTTSLHTFFSLSHPLKSDDPNVPLAIFQTNSIKVSEEAAGIFALTARLNHGCSKAFNSVYSWRKEGILVVHALKHIRRGEEILVAYIDTKQPREIRRATLYEIYGFDCLCHVCSLHSGDVRRSDSRLRAMSTIEADFDAWASGSIDGKEAVRLAKRIWALSEKEGYWSGRGKLADEVAHIAVAHEDEQAARAWAELALEWYAYELGYDSEEVERMRVLQNDPSQHVAWGTREELRVGGPAIDL